MQCNCCFEQNHMIYSCHTPLPVVALWHRQPVTLASWRISTGSTQQAAVRRRTAWHLSRTNVLQYSLLVEMKLQPMKWAVLRAALQGWLAITITEYSVGYLLLVVLVCPYIE